MRNLLNKVTFPRTSIDVSQENAIRMRMLYKKMSDVVEKRSAILCRRIGIEQQNPFFDKDLERRESAARFPMPQVFKNTF